MKNHFLFISLSVILSLVFLAVGTVLYIYISSIIGYILFGISALAFIVAVLIVVYDFIRIKKK